MNFSNYIVEGLAADIRTRRELKNADREYINNEKKKRAKYLRYQQAGGQLSYKNFENKEMRQYELDHRRNPKMYPNFKTWKRLKTEEREKKAKIEEIESKNSKRRAQAEHDKSIAEVNKIRARRMKKENLL